MKINHLIILGIISVILVSGCTTPVEPVNEVNQDSEFTTEFLTGLDTDYLNDTLTDLEALENVENEFKN